MTNIQEWAAGLSDWQSDALRREIRSSELQPADYAVIFANAKAAVGIGKSTEIERCAPLSNSQELAQAGVVSLVTVGPMKSVDRLAEDQTLSFAEKGLTAVYGNNGVGKSGYSRVLKQFCRALEGAKAPIRGDAFKVSLKSPTVDVAYKVGDEDPISWTWQRGADSPKNLGLISVFDTAAARLYVNDQNEIDYLPWQVDLVSRHRRVLERVKIDSQRTLIDIDGRLSRPLPVLHEGTEPYVLASRLKQNSTNPPTSMELQSAFGWDNDQEFALRQKRARLHSDPSVVCAALALADKKVRALAVAMYKAQRLLRQSSIGILVQLEHEQEAALAASEVARAVSLGSQPVANTGSEVWKSLFHAARRFAVEAGYSKPFALTATGEKCVLCQQDLDDTASARMREFDAFVVNEAELRLELAKEALSSALKPYASVKMPVVEDVKAAVVLADPLANVDVLDVATRARGLGNSPMESVEVIRQAANQFPMGLVSALGDLSRSLRQQLEALLLTVNPGNKKVLEGEIEALEDRRTFSEIKADIEGRAEDLRNKNRLKKLIEECSDSAIARYITSIRREFLTDDLASKIREEMAALGLTGIPVSFSDKTQADKSFGRVSIDGMLLPLKNSDILSEGEQRALALSVFLAEMRMISKGNAIVVDDPVSSLDETRMRKVARRLSEVARTRQVVVFTHNMSFFSELRDAALELQTPCRSHYMYRGAGGYGTVQADSVPWELRKLKERIVDLRNEVASITVNVSPERYKISVKQFSVMLRETWERLVEEKLLFEVVLRYARPVHTLKLRGVSVSDDDFSKVFFAMKRASEWSGHDAPIGAPLEPPTLDELSGAIDEIEKYAKEIDTARQAVERQRKLRVPS